MKSSLVRSAVGEGDLGDIKFQGVGEGKDLYKNGKRSIKEVLYFASKLLLRFKGEYDIIDCQQCPYLSCFSAKFHSIIKDSK